MKLKGPRTLFFFCRNHSRMGWDVRRIAREASEKFDREISTKEVKRILRCHPTEKSKENDHFARRQSRAVALTQSGV